MRNYSLILFIAGSAFAISSDPNQLPHYEYDPNSVVVGDSTVTVTMTIIIPKNQAKALNFLDMDIVEIFKRSTVSKLLLKYVKEAKSQMVRNFTVEQLQAKTEE